MTDTAGFQWVSTAPSLGRRWQISLQDGRQPMWSHEGRELYYRDFEGDMWVAAGGPEPGQCQQESRPRVETSAESKTAR
jgi:hypothetical protein